LEYAQPIRIGSLGVKFASAEHLILWPWKPFASKTGSASAN
jgi:hypothetical protein